MNSILLLLCIILEMNAVLLLQLSTVVTCHMD